jgi:hypothetical protein
MIWALAYQTTALQHAPASFGEATIFYPTPHALFYGDAGFGAVPLFFPVFAVTGNAAIASNATFLLSLALTASALHVLVLRWTGSHPGGAFAALTFLLSRWGLWAWVPSAPHYGLLVYLPAIMFLAADQSAKRPWLLSALIVLQGLVTVYDAVPIVVGVALLALWRVGRTRTRAAGLRLVGALAVASVVLAAAQTGFFVVRSTNPALAGQSHWSLERLKVTQLPWGPFDPGAPMRIPLVAFGLLVVGTWCLVRDRERRPEEAAAWQHAAFWSVLGLWASLTPIVSITGKPVNVGWATLAGWVPFFRKPDRMAMIGLVGLAALTGVASAAAFRRFLALAQRRRRMRPLGSLAAVTVALAMYLEYAGGTPGDLDVNRAPLPSTYPLAEAIGESSTLVRVLREGHGPILELPATDPSANARAMYRAIYHRRPILNGYDGYWPATFPSRMALAARLPDRDALAQLRRETGLDTVVVHVGDFGRAQREGCAAIERVLGPREWCRRDFGAAERARWKRFARDRSVPGLRLVMRDGDDLVFHLEVDGS